jgi:hypothetical protein
MLSDIEFDISLLDRPSSRKDRRRKSSHPKLLMAK